MSLPEVRISNPTGRKFTVGVYPDDQKQIEKVLGTTHFIPGYCRSRRKVYLERGLAGVAGSKFCRNRTVATIAVDLTERFKGVPEFDKIAVVPELSGNRLYFSLKGRAKRA